MDIREAYEVSLGREGHVRDPAQVVAIKKLATLQRRIESRESNESGWLRWLPARFKTRPPAVKGLYLWGGVGRGKTFLMDLFYDSLKIDQKKRVHFHRMMKEVHDRLRELGDIEDPLDMVAAGIAAETRVLCFDEFFVSDIADAMILGRLLDSLFRRGVTLVATSNSRPDELYKDGLQRQRFLPAIDLINANADILHMDSGTDYRLRLLEQAGTYLVPDDAAATAKLNYFFDESANSHRLENPDLDINGRSIRALRCAKGIAWFDFLAICDGPRSQSDYIELARWYPNIIVSGVPQLDATREDQARRFIALVDEFYDRRVKLILSAAADATALYTGSRLEFEFDRTRSRLIEMQSTDYLALPHLA
ncbi:MAG: cell division protein ZapE [Gammaproteobacteria bacterium]|nr:cell division protein ZapE [Gammaproteobacteria bacterium]